MGNLKSSRNARIILVLGLAFLAMAAAFTHDYDDDIGGGVSRRLLLNNNKKKGQSASSRGGQLASRGSGKRSGGGRGKHVGTASGGVQSASGRKGAASGVGQLAIAAGGGGGGGVFDVTKYGAKADGKSDSTQGFMKAWVAACQAGGKATFLVPKGTFVTGPLLFEGPCKTSPIYAQIQGTVLGTNDLSQYAEGYWVGFHRINGLIVNGGGTFDGQGPSVWKYNDCKKNPKCTPLPTSIKFGDVQNAVVSGITSVNAKFFHYLVTVCKNFTAHDLTIIAPDESPNTDGMHFSRSDKVSVSNTIIGTGDDCISIGDGVTNAAFTRIKCGPGHGLSVGSLGRYQNEQDVSGISFINCTLSNTTNGARIKSWPGSPPSKASNIIFQDILMNHVYNPIIIDQTYGSKGIKTPSRVAISNIQYRNIKGTSASNVAVDFQCSAAFPCQGIQMSGIQLTYKGDNPRNTTILSSSSNAKVQSSGGNKPYCK